MPFLMTVIVRNETRSRILIMMLMRLYSLTLPYRFVKLFVQKLEEKGL